jgi:hypothetical protein
MKIEFIIKDTRKSKYLLTLLDMSSMDDWELRKYIFNLAGLLRNIYQEPTEPNSKEQQLNRDSAKVLSDYLQESKITYQQITGKPYVNPPICAFPSQKEANKLNREQLRARQREKNKSTKKAKKRKIGKPKFKKKAIVLPIQAACRKRNKVG